MKISDEEALSFRLKITEDFKKQIVFEILAGKTYKQVQEEYRAPSIMQLIAWVRIYQRKIKMGQVKLPALTEEQKKNMKEVKLRTHELEQALEEAELKVLALNTMIDIAEKQFNITIRKKSGTKQSK
jgi:transposase